MSRGETMRGSFGTVRASQNAVGVSGGMAAAVRGRLGVHAALEWLRMFDRSRLGVTLPGGDRVTPGAGVPLLFWGVPWGGAAPAGTVRVMGPLAYAAFSLLRPHPLDQDPCHCICAGAPRQVWLWPWGSSHSPGAR